MITLDGVEFTVKTAKENTQDMLDAINKYCADNDVRNSKNEVIFIDANYANPLYMILWGLGYLVTIFQNLVYGLGKALSIQGSDEQALLNLADMAAIKRGKPSRTTFPVFVRAMLPEEAGYDYEIGSCTITSEDKITYQGVTYTPALHPSIVLQPGESTYITMVADEEGSYAISEDVISSFDSAIANLGTFKQEASTPGQEEESLQNLRARLQRRQLQGTSIDKAMDAIRALPGVTLCNIVYNTSVDETLLLGSDAINIKPREAVCIVQGYNQNIAQTFYSYLSAPSIPNTALGLNPERIVDIQYYTSHAGQQIPLVIVAPKKFPLSISVFINTPVQSDVEMQMKDTICQLAKELTVGEAVTTSSILAILSPFAKYQVLGATLTDGFSTASYTTKNLERNAPDVLWTFDVKNIQVVMPEVAND